MKRKIWSLLVVLVLAVTSLVGCGAKEKPAAAKKTEEIKITITEINKTSRPEVVTIVNNGSSDVNMTGWRLDSINLTHPNDPSFPVESYNFPTAFVLKAGETIKILSDKGAAPGEGILFWDTDSHWYNKDKNNAILYSNTGTKIFEFEDTTVAAPAATAAPSATTAPSPSATAAPAKK